MSLSGHRVFISHRHDYHDDFASLTRRLRRAGFDAVDTSVAVHARFEGKPKWWLEREIAKRIRNADVVLVFGNMGIVKSDWCRSEEHTSELQSQ